MGAHVLVGANHRVWHADRVSRSFHGLRPIAVVLGVVLLVLDVAAVVAVVGALTGGGGVQASWLVVLLAGAVFHALVGFAWSFRMVREPGVTYTAVGRRRLAVLHDEDVVALRRAGGA